MPPLCRPCRDMKTRSCKPLHRWPLAISIARRRTKVQRDIAIMPGTTLPPVPHYEPPSPTKEDGEQFGSVNTFMTLTNAAAVDWAEFPLIDLSKAQTAEGRAELAPIVRDAMRTYGFLYVVNHGLSQAQVGYSYPLSGKFDSTHPGRLIGSSTSQTCLSARFLKRRRSNWLARSWRADPTEDTRLVNSG